MIHVRMGQEDKIDGRQLRYQEPGSALPAQHNQPLRKHWIDEHLPLAHLEQEGGVADEGYAEILRAH
jgi:hypothetical protein